MSTEKHNNENDSNQNVGDQADVAPQGASAASGSGSLPDLARSPAEDVEETLWSGGYSSKDMIGIWILLGIVSVALALVAVFSPPLVLVLLLIPVIWIVGALRYAWRRFGVQYELTSQRFIHQTGVVTRKTDRIELIDIDDVSYSQGPVQRLSGVGKIVLTGSDVSHPTLTMPGIANVREVAGLIDDVRRKERRRRSVYVEQL